MSDDDNKGISEGFLDEMRAGWGHIPNVLRLIREIDRQRGRYAQNPAPPVPTDGFLLTMAREWGHVDNILALVDEINRYRTANAAGAVFGAAPPDVTDEFQAILPAAMQVMQFIVDLGRRETAQRQAEGSEAEDREFWCKAFMVLLSARDNPAPVEAAARASQCLALRRAAFPVGVGVTPAYPPAGDDDDDDKGPDTGPH